MHGEREETEDDGAPNDPGAAVLTPELLEELVGLGSGRRVAAGEVIADAGDDADEVYLVIDGLLHALVRTPHGEILTGRLASGAIVGEITVVTGGRRTATLQAAEPTEIVGIPREQFERWLADRPRLADLVSAQARERLDRSQVAEMIVAIVGDQPDTVKAVLAAVQWRHLEAGERLFREGDQSDAAYFVVNGRLLVTQTDDEGAEKLLSEVGRGDVVGELGLLDDAPRSATVRAARDCTLAAFPASAFEDLVATSPQLMLHVARGIVETLRRTGRRSRARATTLAIAVVTPTDRAHVLRVVAEELVNFGSVRVLTSEGVDEFLHRPGIAQAPVANIGLPRLSEFLHEAEIGNDHLVLAADAVSTTWTRRALRQSDRVIAIASARPDAAERARIAELVETVSDMEHVPVGLVALHDDGVERPTGTPELRASLHVDDVVHVRRHDDVGLARATRLACGHGIGLVLSGGGARGFAHLGVYRALREAGIPVDAIGGCSIGAPIGAGIARGVPVDEQVDLAQQLFDRLLDYTLPVVALLRGRRITASIQEAFSGWDIEDLWLPYYCVSTDLTTSQLAVHRSGDCARAVRASVSIPGVLPPVPIGRSLHVDGGVLNNLPVEAMAADPRIGAVLAVDVAPPVGPRAKSDYGLSVPGTKALYATATRRGPRYPKITSVLIRSMLAGAIHHQQRAVDTVAPTAVFRLTLAGVGLLEFDRVHEVSELGRHAVADQVADFAAEHPELVRSAGR